jgi:hypothetical protein
VYRNAPHHSSSPRTISSGVDFPLWFQPAYGAQAGDWLGGNSGEVAMLIPSIDLMGGKIVQLVQGSRKALEFDNFQEWVDRFANYPLVQLIDLDAAMGRGNNSELVREFARQLPCQVGGGIRSVETAKAIFSGRLSFLREQSTLVSLPRLRVRLARINSYSQRIAEAGELQFMAGRKELASQRWK